ncbi:DUF3892 domain-containing protein [Oenococcus oeni]|uniref:DUF3892 domain-containing protein n=1 Tax=Oenococcus oeni TaxID=1247 RepID=UPI00067B699D|nr:DUF3892 domain-containing protein [Oenococcus oeni]
MIYATAVKMQSGRAYSHDVLAIDSIQLKYSNGDISWSKKEDIYNHLLIYPKSIKVNISPYPDLIPEHDGFTKYVKSQPDRTGDDKLLSLQGGPNNR